MATNSNNVPTAGEIEIRNTLYFDFSEAPIPSEYDFWKWLHELGCGEDDFEVIDFRQPSPQTSFKPMAVTRFRTEEAFSKFVTKFAVTNPKIILKNTEYSIPFKTTCTMHKKVRIFNVPFEVALGEVQTSLEPYGTVFCTEREKPKSTLEKFFKNVVYEKIVITMDLKKDIPDHIMIGKNKFKVSYPGQPRMCAYCKKEGHTIKQCEKTKNKATTWAQKVKNGGVKDKNQPIEINDPYPELTKIPIRNIARVQKATEVVTSTPLMNKFATLGTSIKSKNKRDRHEEEEVETHSSERNLPVEKAKRKKRKTNNSSIIRDTEKTVGSNLTPATPTSIFPNKSPSPVRSTDLNTSNASNNLTIQTSEDEESQEINPGQNQIRINTFEIEDGIPEQVFVPSDPGKSIKTLKELIRRFSETEKT